MKNDFGILYVATGEKYVEECIRSANSAKTVMPNIPISLWTDVDTVRLNKNLFDSIQILNNPKFSYIDKIEPLLETKYEKTLFVDTDTFFIESIYEVFTMLNQYEFAYAHAPWRIPPWEDSTDINIPLCFPEPNTGVIAYRMNKSVIDLIKNWRVIYLDQLKGNNASKHDQSALRKALYLSNVRSTVLPPEYNFRTIFPGFKGGCCPVKILHGRDPSLSQAIKTVNIHNGITVFDFSKPRHIF